MSRLPKEITMTLLQAIFQGGEVTMTQLQRMTGFSTITVLNHVEELVIADLVEERREKELPKRRFLKLSREGLRAASMLNLLTNTMIDAKGVIELGAKAGRMVAYREAAILLRQQNVTRDYATAEYLLRDLESLVESLGMISNALPREFRKESEALVRVREKLQERVNESRKHLQKNDIRGSAETVNFAWKEYSGNYANIEQLLSLLRDRKLEELLRIIEFVTPKPTQKD